MSEAYGMQTGNTATPSFGEKPKCKEYKIWQDDTMNLYIYIYIYICTYGLWGC